MVKEPKVEAIYGQLCIDGRFFQEYSKDGKTVWKAVPKSKVNKKIKMAKALAKKLKYGLDAEKVLEEALVNLEQKEIEKLYKIAFDKKRKYKAKTRKHHCVDMKVGNFILPIR